MLEAGSELAPLVFFATCIADGLRFAWTVHPLGDDILCDIVLGRAAPKLGRAPHEGTTKP